MSKRLFTAVNLPQEVKYAIEWKLNEMTKFFPGRVHLLPPENWHITVTFLGEQEEEKLPLIYQSVQKASERLIMPEIKLSKIHFGPSENNPRMIWVFGDSPELAEAKKIFDKELAKAEIDFQRENDFIPHITISRLSDDVYFHMPPQPLGESFKAETIDLMESVLKRPVAEYNILEKFYLNG